MPPELVGLCFNCLASSLVEAKCTFQARCFNRWCVDHRAHACPLAPRSTLGKRGRSPPRPFGCRQLPRRGARHDNRRAFDGDDDTPSTRSASTGQSTSAPRCCRPPTPLGPPPPPSSPNTIAAQGALDVSRLGLLCRSSFVVVPHSVNLQASEDDLSSALVVLVGETWPEVSMAMVAAYLYQRFEINYEDVDIR